MELSPLHVQYKSQNFSFNSHFYFSVWNGWKIILKALFTWSPTWLSNIVNDINLCDFICTIKSSIYNLCSKKEESRFYVCVCTLNKLFFVNFTDHSEFSIHRPNKKIFTFSPPKWKKIWRWEPFENINRMPSPISRKSIQASSKCTRHEIRIELNRSDVYLFENLISVNGESFYRRWKIHPIKKHSPCSVVRKCKITEMKKES